jgi:TolB-like protein
MVSGCASLPFGLFGQGATKQTVRKDTGGRPTLGILPFAATGQDGETVATLFSNQAALLETFTVVPRTAALNVILESQGVSFAESNDMAKMINLLNAEYVLSGSIRRLGDRNLLIASILNVETFELVAGYYLTYREIGEVPVLLPAMVKSLVDTFALERRPADALAIPPFSTKIKEVSQQDLDTLAEIIAIELLSTGRYSILPRTAAIQAAIKEQDLQMSGLTDSERTARIGGAANAEFVLNGSVGRLDTYYTFTAEIYNMRSSVKIIGKDKEYNDISQGIGIMAELAILLTEPDEAVATTKIAERQRQDRERQAAEDRELSKRQNKIAAANKKIQAAAKAEERKKAG